MYVKILQPFTLIFNTMYLKLKLLLIIGFCAFTTSLFSQQDVKGEGRVTEKIYSYRFSGPLSVTDRESLRTDVLNMRFAAEVKIEYKAEKSIGQIRVWTKEKFIDTDTEFQFNILKLGEVLRQHNLEPIEYNADKISKN